MMGPTHALIGAAVGLGLGGLAGAGLPDALLLGGLAGAAALLPDVDHPRGQIRRGLGLVGHVGFFWLSHRGVTHTLAALALVAVAAGYALGGWLALAVIAGYASHLAGDMLTRAGLPVLWPLYGGSLHLLPKWARLRTGGLLEGLLSAAVFVGVVCALSWWL